MNRQIVILSCLLATAAVAQAKDDTVNLALFATPTTSFVSGHETLDAINDGFEPHDVNDHSHGCYGNWPQTGTQWVQYEWSQPVTTAKTEVYWWDDARGVRLPKAARLLSWEGNAFKEVAVVGVAGALPQIRVRARRAIRLAADRVLTDQLLIDARLVRALRVHVAVPVLVAAALRPGEQHGRVAAGRRQPRGTLPLVRVLVAD